MPIREKGVSLQKSSISFPNSIYFTEIHHSYLMNSQLNKRITSELKRLTLDPPPGSFVNME